MASGKRLKFSFYEVITVKYQARKTPFSISFGLDRFWRAYPNILKCVTSTTPRKATRYIKKGKKEWSHPVPCHREERNNNEPKQNKTKREHHYANKVQIFTKLYF